MCTKAYTLTYLGLLSLNLMKTSVMLVNEGLAEALNAKEGDLHLFFACSYILGATACLYHLFFPLTRSVYAYSLNIFIASALLTLIYPFSTDGQHNQILIFLFVMIFGWGTGTGLPLLITIMSRYHRVGQCSGMAGLWMSGSNMGSLLGFLLCLSLPWYFALVISGIVSMVLCYALCVGLGDTEQSELSTPTCNFSEQIQSLFTFCSHLDHFLNLLISTSLASSVFLLTFWLSCLEPSQLSTFIPLSYCFFAALGTSLLAWAYGQLKGKRKHQLAIISICLILIIVLLILQNSTMIKSDLELCGVMMMLGLFLGAVCNISSVHEPLLLAHSPSLPPAFILMLFAAAWNLAIGVFYLFSHLIFNYFPIFSVVILLNTFAFILLFFRILLQPNQYQYLPA